MTPGCQIYPQQERDTHSHTHPLSACSASIFVPAVLIHTPPPPAQKYGYEPA